MKMSYRDKVILIVLLVILVWAIGIMYFIKPKLDDLDKANKEYDAAVLTLEKRKSEIEADKDLKERVTAAYDRVTKLCDTFYNKMTSDEVSTLIDTLLDEDNITNDSLSISAYGSSTLDTVNGTPMEATTPVDILAEQSKSNVNDNGTGEIVSSTEIEGATGPVTIPAYTLSFGFKDTKLDDLKSFLDKLHDAEQCSLIVTDCKITDVTADVIDGNMTMVLLMMPRMANPLEKETAQDSSES